MPEPTEDSEFLDVQPGVLDSRDLRLVTELGFGRLPELVVLRVKFEGWCEDHGAVHEGDVVLGVSDDVITQMIEALPKILRVPPLYQPPGQN